MGREGYLRYETYQIPHAKEAPGNYSGIQIENLDSQIYEGREGGAGFIFPNRSQCKRQPFLTMETTTIDSR